MSATRTANVTTPTRTRRVPAVVVADLVIAAALFAVAILDPFSLSIGARWAVAAVGDLAVLLAVVGIVRVRRAEHGPAGRR